MPTRRDIELRQVASELNTLLSREVVRDFRPIILPEKFLDGNGKPTEVIPDFSEIQLQYINQKIASRLSSVYAGMRNVLKQVEDNLTKLNSGYYNAVISDYANPHVEKSFRLPQTETELDRKVYNFPYDANGVPYTVGVDNRFYEVTTPKANHGLTMAFFQDITNTNISYEVWVTRPYNGLIFQVKKDNSGSVLWTRLVKPHFKEALDTFDVIIDIDGWSKEGGHTWKYYDTADKEYSHERNIHYNNIIRTFSFILDQPVPFTLIFDKVVNRSFYYPVVYVNGSPVDMQDFRYVTQQSSATVFLKRKYLHPDDVVTIQLRKHFNSPKFKYLTYGTSSINDDQKDQLLQLPTKLGHPYDVDDFFVVENVDKSKSGEFYDAATDKLLTPEYDVEDFGTFFNEQDFIAFAKSSKDPSFKNITGKITAHYSTITDENNVRPKVKFSIDGDLYDGTDSIQIVFFNNSCGWELYRDTSSIIAADQLRGVKEYSGVKEIDLSAIPDFRSYVLEENYLDPLFNPYFCIHDYGCTMFPLPVNDVSELSVFVNEIDADGNKFGYELVPNIDFTLKFGKSDITTRSGMYITFVRPLRPGSTFRIIKREPKTWYHEQWYNQEISAVHDRFIELHHSTAEEVPRHQLYMDVIIGNHRVPSDYIDKVSDEIFYLWTKEVPDYIQNNILVSIKIPKCTVTTENIYNFNKFTKKVTSNAERQQLVDQFDTSTKYNDRINLGLATFPEFKDIIVDYSTASSMWRNFEFTTVNRNYVYVNCLDNLLEEHEESHFFKIYDALKCPSDGAVFYCRTHNPEHPDTFNTSTNGRVKTSKFILVENPAEGKKYVRALKKLNASEDKFAFYSEAVVQTYLYDPEMVLTVGTIESKEEASVQWLNNKIFYGNVAKNGDIVLDADTDQAYGDDILVADHSFTRQIVNNNNAVIDSDKVYYF